MGYKIDYTNATDKEARALADAFDYLGGVKTELLIGHLSRLLPKDSTDAAALADWRNCARAWLDFAGVNGLPADVFVAAMEDGSIDSAHLAHETKGE